VIGRIFSQFRWRIFFICCHVHQLSTISPNPRLFRRFGWEFVTTLVTHAGYPFTHPHYSFSVAQHPVSNISEQKISFFIIISFSLPSTRFFIFFFSYFKAFRCCFTQVIEYFLVLINLTKHIFKLQNTKYIDANLTIHKIVVLDTCRPYMSSLYIPVPNLCVSFDVYIFATANC